ncbi:hypothetical protein GUITHDRAFT_149957, partial [Guillardia theta CCMP2712]
MGKCWSRPDHRIHPDLKEDATALDFVKKDSQIEEHPVPNDLGGCSEEDKLHVKVAALQEVGHEKSSGFVDVATPSLISIETSTPVCLQSDVQAGSTRLSVLNEDGRHLQDGRHLDQNLAGQGKFPSLYFDSSTLSDDCHRKQNDIQQAPTGIVTCQSTHRPIVPDTSESKARSVPSQPSVSELKTNSSNRNKENLDRQNVKRLASSDRSSFKRSDSSS